MTWCAKIYEMFNGWTDEEHQLALEGPSATRPRPNQFATISLDSPFLARSTSIDDPPLFNSTFRDYQGEHVCVDTSFSCHQLDQRDEIPLRPYGIATIANTALNLPKSMGNRQANNQRRKHAPLSRSLSFEYPMYEQHSSLPARTRHSLNPLTSRQRPNSARQDSTGYRVSTRSTYSINDSDHRNDEQIEKLVQTNIKEWFRSSPDRVFPMIYRLSPDEDDRYRIEGDYEDPSRWTIQTKMFPNDCQISTQNIASIYSKFFCDESHQSHQDLYGIDEESNPVVMSIQRNYDHLSVIVRTKDGSRFITLSNNESSSMNNVELAAQVYSDLKIDHFENCQSADAREHIKTFDEKLEIQKFKFGVIYQKKGQTTEEEFFNNNEPKRPFEEFLDQIASKVSLKNFKGYRAGLDVSEQTDCPHSYYEVFDEKEIMFHVSTMLPYSRNDTTQIQRKRHIGNDIVAIIFQEENTPFHPSMIKSSFLHVFLVVQPAQFLSKPCYKMMLVSRYDIEPFPPRLHRNTVYVRNAEKLRDFILTKLINAEYAAYRCRTFSLLQERTRSSYLKTLCETLSEKTYETLCDEKKRSSHRRTSLLSNHSRKKYLPSVSKLFRRSQTLPDESRHSIKSDHVQLKSAKKLTRTVHSVDIDEHLPSSSEHRDDSSNDDQRSSTIPRYFSARNPMYYGDESDEGLDSMSSADTTRAPYDSDDTDNFAYQQKIRERSHPIPNWSRLTNQRHITTPQTAGIHMSESSTV